MRYDKENDRLIISVPDMVAIARRGISSSLPCDEDEPEYVKNYTKDSTELSLDFTAGEFSSYLTITNLSTYLLRIVAL